MSNSNIIDTMEIDTPRIYVYKVTFEEVPYFYIGVHKEKKFNERYFGSPCKNKWCWDFYTPEKQILEVFEYSNDGWLKALEIEKKLIRYFFKADKWCLNRSCGGGISLEELKKSGLRNKDLGIGIFSMTKEEKIEAQKKSDKKAKENGNGIYSLTPDGIKKAAQRGGQRTKELGVGYCGLSFEERSAAGKKSGAQKWMCLETGYICNAGPLSLYQRKRGIDTNKRIKLE